MSKAEENSMEVRSYGEVARDVLQARDTIIMLGKAIDFRYPSYYEEKIQTVTTKRNAKTNTEKLVAEYIAGLHVINTLSTPAEREFFEIPAETAAYPVNDKDINVTIDNMFDLGVVKAARLAWAALKYRPKI